MTLRFVLTYDFKLLRINHIFLTETEVLKLYNSTSSKENTQPYVAQDNKIKLRSNLIKP